MMGYAKQGQNTGGENNFNQGEEQIFPEIFGTKRLAKNYTRLGTYINCQLNKDQIQYQVAFQELRSYARTCLPQK